ncbi:MAG: hypothetical protein AAES65_17560 [Candidatus Thiodiazotropha sp. (ex. Lucinoma kazani)]
MAEPIMDKEKPNFCGYFEPTMDVSADKGNHSDDTIRQAAEDLFKL